ncbi:MAG: RNA pseudouridine synthase [Planctomycetaceae bacterium]|nr:RNA pseudouridine synthase [Planctomycetaceae bacterium]
MTTALELCFAVDKYLSGRRVDVVLQRNLRNHTRFRIHRLVQAGLVQVDGTVVSIDRRVYPGQQIRIRLVEPPDKLLRAAPLPVRVLFEDRWLVAIDKPAGQIVHPAAVDRADTVVNALQCHLDGDAAVRGLLRPGIVHRLDRDTSGVLITTKHHLAHRNLSISFQQRRITKTYLALVEGHLARDNVTIDTPIGRVCDPDSNLMSAQPDAISPRSASTEFTVVRRLSGCSLVEARPLTGRLHQIRVHLAAIGHPILGERFYGPHGQIREDRHGRRLADSTAEHSAPPLARQALHASSLEFDHPITEQAISIEAPLADDLQRALTAAGGG